MTKLFVRGLWFGHNEAMERVVGIFHSFRESDRATKRYYLSLTPEQWMEIFLELLHREQPDENQQGRPRVYRIVKLQES